MASRHIMSKESMLSRFGNILLNRKNNIYVLNETEAISIGLEDIVVEPRMSVINPDICSVSDLVSSGIANSVYVYSVFQGDSVCHKWTRNGIIDLWVGTYSEGM